MDVAEWALGQAKADRRDVLIVDTAGRLHVDEELMDQLAQIKKRVKPHDVLLVVDAMTGQDAVNVAESFAGATAFDGVILSKLDGDARGGAALSVKAHHRQADPLRLDRREARRLRALPPRPDGPADPRDGRRDDADREGRAADGRATSAAELERKIKKNQFTLDDFLEQMQQVRSMGPLQGNLLKMIPGVGPAAGRRCRWTIASWTASRRSSRR